MGLCRELQDDYGLETTAEDVAVLANEVPPAVRRADLLVTTTRHAAVVRGLAEQLRKHCVIASVRPDLITGQWRMLLQAPVYVVIADRRFEDTLRQFFADTPGALNLRPVIVGEDDLSLIPPDAPTYLTRSAREKLGSQRIPGRIIPAPRLLSSDSAREIITFIVRANLTAMRTSD
jgi:hypothetical protein